MMMRLCILLGTALTICSCGGGVGQPALSPSGDNTAMQTVAFTNKTLESCVQDAMEKQKVSLPAQLKSLKCGTDSKGLKQGLDQNYRDEMNEPTRQVIFSTLGLEQLTALEDLDLGGNWIRDIDLSALKNLRHLTLDTNQIRALDLSANTQLETVNLAFNPIHSINVSNLTRLRSLRFGHTQRFHDGPIQDTYADWVVRDNEVEGKYVDILGDLSPADYEENIEFTGADSLAALEEMIFQFKRPLNFDFSLLTRLQSLIIVHSDLETLSLTNSKNLVSVSLHDNKLTEIVLPEANLLQHLEIQNNALTELTVAGGAVLETVIAENNQLHTVTLERAPTLELNLAHNLISDVNAAFFEQVKNIDLSYNQIARYSGCGVASTETINLSHNKIAEFATDCIYLSLDADLSFNAIEQLNIAGRRGARLRTVNIANNKLKKIYLNYVIEKLNISNNKIEDFVAFRASDTLVSLSADNAFSLPALDLPNLKKLNRLNLSSYLESTYDFSVHPNLQTLVIDNNTWPSIDVSALKGLLYLSAVNLGLSSLDLSNNPNLLGLDIRDNKIEQLDFSVLKESNTRANHCNGILDFCVTFIDVQGNPMSMELVKSLRGLFAFVDSGWRTYFDF